MNLYNLKEPLKIKEDFQKIHPESLRYIRSMRYNEEVNPYNDIDTTIFISENRNCLFFITTQPKFEKLGYYDNFLEEVNNVYIFYIPYLYKAAAHLDKYDWFYIYHIVLEKAKEHQIEDYWNMDHYKILKSYTKEEIEIVKRRYSNFVDKLSEKQYFINWLEQTGSDIEATLKKHYKDKKWLW
ncbi:hypothetical protein [Mycoplasma procyoni]|uniref:hypothetical protein n=1 Tax=Mycoplasma procyoni TaxID=568784 RepID=UPI00197C3078|nr:hypothetical protein [Mycoplasma procyoni]MBN3534880.1 hypothetical protein [Mycoplasma procyoni]